MADRAAEVAARFGNDGLAPLWRTLRSRYERAGDRPVRRVRVPLRDDVERRALAELLGLPRLPQDHVTVSVAVLDGVLGKAVAGLDTRTAVEVLRGPINDVAGLRQAAARARGNLWRWLDEHPVVRAEPALKEWADDMRRAGVVAGSVERTRAELELALCAIGALPADGRSLPSFAHAVCGDPHALDDSTRLGNRVLRAVAVLRDRPLPTDAEGRRALWAAVGVACDALSTAVLVAGLRPRDVGVLAATLRAWADAGQAAWVTLAQLHEAAAAGTPALGGSARVWVVENPSVVAEALRRFGACCPPIVCTSGWPTGAAIELLRRLAASGACLAYHGDLDGEGVRIAAHVTQRTPAVPFAMSAEDYRRAVRPDGPPVGRVTEAPWDSTLAAAMRQLGAAVPEEQVCDELLGRMAAP